MPHLLADVRRRRDFLRTVIAVTSNEIFNSLLAKSALIGIVVAVARADRDMIATDNRVGDTLILIPKTLYQIIQRLARGPALRQREFRRAGPVVQR